MKFKVMFRKFECRYDIHSIHYKTQTGTSGEKWSDNPISMASVSDGEDTHKTLGFILTLVVCASDKESGEKVVATNRKS